MTLRWPSVMLVWIPMLSVVLVVLAAIVVLATLVFWLVGERGRLRSSTRAFFAQGPFNLNRLHGYIYGRWTPQYARALFSLPSPDTSKTSARLVRWFSDRHHGKVLTTENGRAIVRLDEPIRRRDLEQIVPACPTGAIRMERDENKGIPLDVNALG